MTNVRLPRALCSVVGEFIQGSHATLDALFISSGAPGDPPNLSHHSKWKEWLFRAGQDASVDSLAVLGNILEEFMDIPPAEEEYRRDWEQSRQSIAKTLEEYGFRYFRGGRVLPNGQSVDESSHQAQDSSSTSMKPNSVEGLLEILVKGLPRAMYPLANRRKGSESLSFSSEYDIQDLLHALLRPWVSDVRPEEFTPSYAGSSTRMDFLLPAHSLVIETKLVRDRAHGRRIGQELIIDLDHYRAHPDCSVLWCVIFDPNHYIPNAGGLIGDLEGESRNDKGTLRTRVVVI